MTSVPATITGVEAPWKQRFRAERILWSALAEERPDRGLVASNRSGRYQLYAWEVPTGELRQLTDRPEGVLFGFIDALGRHVYYLDDRDGNEIGHLVRVPFGGGEPEDTSPNLPAYSTWGGVISATGNRLAFTRADHEGFTLTAVDLGPGRGDERAAGPLPQRAGHVAAGPFAGRRPGRRRLDRAQHDAALHPAGVRHAHR